MDFKEKKQVAKVSLNIAFQSFRKRWKNRLLEFAKSKTKENDGKCENRQKRYEGV